MPYSFYVAEQEISSSLGHAVGDASTEQAIRIVYVPQAVLRVRAVARGAHDGKTGERRDFVSSHFVRDFVHRTRAAD